MLTRAYPVFDHPVILFQNIIQVLDGAVLAIVIQSTLDPKRLGWRADLLLPLGDCWPAGALTTIGPQA